MTLFFVFLIGLATGVIDTVAGIGGLFSIPLLVLSGLPPQTAIACDRFGVIGASLFSFLRYLKSGNILWKWIPVLSALAVAGGLIGANVVVSVEPETLKKVIGVIVLLSLPIIFLKKEIGVIHRPTGNLRKAAGLVLFFSVMIYGGFLGVSSGPLLMIIFSTFLGFTILQTQATGQMPWIALSIASFIVFGIHGFIDWPACLAMIAGMATGGWVGTGWALKLGNRYLKYILGLVCAGVCVVLLLGI